MDKKIFIVGAPRSGTTYLARAMGLGEDVAYFEESGAYSLYGARRFAAWHSRLQKETGVFESHLMRQKLCAALDTCRRKNRLGDMVSRMLRHTKLQPYDLKPSDPLIDVQNCRLDERDDERRTELIGRYVRLSHSSDGTAFYRAFFEDFVELSGKKHLLEKTPDQIEEVPVIMKTFPDAGIVLITRDKRDAVASFLCNYTEPDRFYDAFTPARFELVRLCRLYAYYERLEKWIASRSGCRSVSYSALVQDPLATVERILQWAGVEFDVDKHRSLFAPRQTDSKWNRLTSKQKQLVERFL